MKFHFGSQARARAFALLILGTVFLGCGIFLYRAFTPSAYQVQGALDIAGAWDFRNGSTDDFRLKVEVPNPLPEEIRKNLADEFWYRTRFSLPDEFKHREIALSLGGVKGVHEVYWNGKYLGAGGKTGVGVFRIPSRFLNDSSVELTVRVKNSSTLFPGIVHMNPVVVGDASEIEKRLTQYYFDTGLKPLLPGILKLTIFFLFIGLFISVPYKREHFSFSLFALFASFASIFYSRFTPFYDDFYFKNALIFLSTVLSFGMIPFMSADFLRLSEKNRATARIFGGSICLVFLGAALLTNGQDRLIMIYRSMNAYMPFMVAIPCAVFGFHEAWKIGPSLRHRQIQICLFGAFLLVGAISWSGGSFLNFQRFFYPEFLDLGIFAGLALALAMDFRSESLRSRRADKIVPKWFTGFLSTNVDSVTMDIPLLVMAVDTVGYTKTLATLDSVGKGKLHEDMRILLSALTEKYKAQKISERGDGGLFAWDFPLDAKERKKSIDLFVGAIKHLASGHDRQLIFRVGAAQGSVRCEMKGGEFSFLGEALNCASRLETIAENGAVLVHDTLIEKLPEEFLAADWVSVELKGVVYRAKAMRAA